MSLNTRGESCIRESHYSKPRTIDLRTGCFSVKGDPDVGRALSAHFVKSKCREKTDDTSRHLLRHFRKSEVARDGCLRKRVYTAPDFDEQTFLMKATKMLGMDSLLR